MYYITANKTLQYVSLRAQQPNSIRFVAHVWGLLKRDGDGKESKKYDGKGKICGGDRGENDLNYIFS